MSSIYGAAGGVNVYGSVLVLPLVYGIRMYYPVQYGRRPDSVLTETENLC